MHIFLNRLKTEAIIRTFPCIVEIGCLQKILHDCRHLNLGKVAISFLQNYLQIVIR